MKALIAMSGGVDSSVAALITKEQGYECVGCTMKLHRGEEPEAGVGRTCCSLSDTEDARLVALKIGIPYYVFNFTDDFEEKVIEPFVKAYESGMTPNPCIECNRHLKFDRLYERAKILGMDTVVTGHYARITEENGRFFLKKALDEKKDQSYVLYRLTEEQLKHTRFPLGEMMKEEIRSIAAENGFLNADKPDSQDICFIPDGDYASFLENYRGKKYPEGPFVKDGVEVGRHQGIVRYTVGQRKGLGIAFGEPVYVTELDPETNTVTLGSNADLYADTAAVEDVHWIAGEAPAETFDCLVKTRYHQKEVPCTVTVLEGGLAKIQLKTPVRAVTPGQAAVFYDGDTVLGGGVIVSPSRIRSLS